MLLSVFQNIFGLNHSANTVIKTVSMLHVRHIKVSRNQKHVPLHTFYATSGFGPPDLKENLRHGILLATVASVLLLVGSILTWLGMFIFDFIWYIVQFWLSFVCNIYLSFFFFGTIWHMSILFVYWLAWYVQFWLDLVCNISSNFFWYSIYHICLLACWFTFDLAWYLVYLSLFLFFALTYHLLLYLLCREIGT